MLSGFLAPSAGSVRIFGFDMQDKARQAQKLIGYLPENSLPATGETTVEGFLAFVASIRDYSGRENVGASTAPWTAWSCGMSAGASSKPCPRASSAASRWPRRSSTIPSCSARRAHRRPDPNQKHQVRQLVKNLSESKIVVISTHILEEVSFRAAAPW